MVFRNWIKTLTITAARQCSRRDRRKMRSASGQVVLIREEFVCAPMVETLETRTLLSANLELVANIMAGAGGSYPSQFVNVNGTLFFTAFDNTNGAELWQSNGSEAGTTIVRDIRTGSGGSSPYYLTNVNGTLFFRANDGTNGDELWQSDGTSSGTTLVKDIFTGSGGSDPHSLANVNGTLFFLAFDGTNGNELWRSDGTSVGTTLVKDHLSGSGGPNPNPSSLTNVNGTLFFCATDGASGYELWQSDGTSAGTTLVKDIRTGSNGSNPSSLTNVNGTLFFRANDGTNGYELWQSDGTAAGTTLVKDLITGGIGSYPRSLTNVNGTLFFSAADDTNRYKLWRSDGTSAGTTKVNDFVTGSGGRNTISLTNVNGTLFFRATDGALGYQLWQSDGTSAGTTPFKGNNTVGGAVPNYLTNVNGTLFFSAYDGTSGSELWKAEIPADTPNVGVPEISFLPPTLVKDIVTGSGGSSSYFLTNVNGTLFFISNDGVSGYELWQSDGTSAGTTLVKDIFTGSSHSTPNSLANVNGTLYFSANDGSNGFELWRSDGTTVGTTLVKDINPLDDSSPLFLTNVNGTLFFIANDGVNGYELWQSDGTANGTILVKDIVTGSSSSYLRSLTNVNGMLFFTADDGVNGYELWQSDGTANGTMLVKDINNGAGASFPRYLTNMNGTLFFTATDGVKGYELWQSDGTANGTILVKEIGSGSLNSMPRYLTNVNGTLFFNATDAANGSELWRSDGTTAGTTLVKDIVSGSDGSSPNYLTNVNGTLFFSGFEDVNGAELWQSDGTSAGTTLVKDIATGNLDSFPRFLTNVNGTLFFNANDGTNGAELWSMPVNALPRLTIFAAVVDSTDADSEVEITFAELLAQSDASDVDGTVNAFIVQAGSSGTLKIGTAPGKATAFAVGSNDRIDATHNAYWTPAGYDNGKAIAAFTVLAQDNIGDNSIRPITAHVAVALPVPAMIGPTALTENQRPTISWSAVSGADHYVLYIRNLDTNANSFRVRTHAGTSYAPTAAFGIGSYEVRVRAISAAGDSSVYSQKLSFRISTPAVFDKVVRFQATTTPTLTLYPLTGAMKFDLWINNMSTGQQQVVREMNVIGTSWTSPTSLPMGKYRAWIRGTDESGVQANWSMAVNFYVLPPVTVVSPVTPTFDQTPTFTWNAVPGAVSYDLYYRNLSIGATATTLTDITATSFTPASILPTGLYRWYVLAVVDGGYRSQSANVQDFIIGGQPTILTPLGSTSNTTPTFSWTPVTGAATYELWVDRIDIPTSETVYHQTGLTSPSFTLTTPLPLSSYRVWVRAISVTSQASAWSLPLDFTITAVTDEPLTLPGDLLLPQLTVLDGVSSQCNERSAMETADSNVPSRKKNVLPDDSATSIVEFEATQPQNINAPSHGESRLSRSSILQPDMENKEAGVDAVMADIKSMTLLHCLKSREGLLHGRMICLQ